ncbi:hypothetical protein LCGC14_3125240, partial [marine sediment metagenome]
MGDIVLNIVGEEVISPRTGVPELGLAGEVSKMYQEALLSAEVMG